MTNPLKIEVTEAMLGAVLMAQYGDGDVSDMLRGGGDEETAIIRAALTAAFQHPEFVRQVRDQVMGALPGESARSERDSDVDWGYFLGHGACRETTRANLSRVLGEDKT